jgi:hypothetical protein
VGPIAERLAAPGAVPSVVGEAFGEGASHAAIEALADAFCREHLGAGLERTEMFAAGRSAVLGLRLAGGRRVIVKVRGARVSPRFLTAVAEIQGALHADGYPAPEPLAGPAPLGRGTATAEAVLERGAPPDARAPGVRHAMAVELRRLVERCDRFAELEGLRDEAWRLAPGSLWPLPHDARYAFAPGDPGAEWIDALAARAIEAAGLREGGAGRPVVCHGDWRVGNLRFEGDELTAVHDWDSLAVEPECAVLGGVAHYFTADWSAPGPHYPGLDEALAFVASYESVRGTGFTAAELRAICATIAYSMAYSARCEHFDAVAGDAPAELPAGSARAFLAAEAARLL